MCKYLQKYDTFKKYSDNCYTYHTNVYLKIVTLSNFSCHFFIDKTFDEKQHEHVLDLFIAQNKPIFVFFIIVMNRQTKQAFIFLA